MKKLIALLAVVSYVPFAQAAEGDWTHSGEFRLQYTNNDEADLDSATADGRGQIIHQRSKLNTTVRAGEKMTFNMGMVHNADWGSNADQTPDDVVGRDAGVGGDPHNNDTNNLLTINEMYATWQASDEMTIKAGRISQTFGDGTIVSANEYLNVQKAFDGGGVVYDLEPVRLAVFGVRGANATTTNSFGSFYGISADLKTMPSFLKMVNLHYIIVKRNADTYEINGADVALSKEDATRIGATVAGDVAGFDYRATYAVHDGDGSDSAAPGTEVSISSSMMDLEVGYSMPAMMNFRVHAGYHTDSGDDDPTPATGGNDRYNPFHYQQHENAGLMDVLGWGNLTYTRVGVALSPMEDLTVGAEYLIFTQTEEDGISYGSDGSTIQTATATAALGGTSPVGEDDLGTELDVVVTKKYTNNFAIQARYGMFSPGDAWTTDDTFTQMYFEGKMTF